MTCYNKVKEWRHKNKDKVNAQARRYRKKHPDKIREIKKRYRNKDIDKIRKIEASQASERRKKDPDGQRRRYLKWREKREVMLCSIAGRPRSLFCEICSLNIYPIVFDHCHNSGKFRGWICDRCNKVLGLVKDSKDLLLKLKFYIEESSNG